MYEPFDESQREILKLILEGKPINYGDIEVCNTILEASLNWTPEDEAGTPALRVAREKAQFQMTAYEAREATWDNGDW